MNYLDDIFLERYEVVKQKVKSIERKESDKIALKLGIGIDTIRRMRYDSVGYTPSVKVVGKLDRYFIDQDKQQG